MTTIKTTCPNCGTIELSVQQLVLEVGSDAVTALYSFVCPMCVEAHSRSAAPRIVLLLQAAGVPTRRGEDLPITEAEIAAFAEALSAEPAPTRML